MSLSSISQVTRATAKDYEHRKQKMADLKIEEQVRPGSVGDGEVGPEKPVLSKDEEHLARLGYKQGRFKNSSVEISKS